MTSADASTMSNDDQRLADILSLLSAIDERLPKRRVKAAAAIAAEPQQDAMVEQPKRARKPSVKAAAAAIAAEAEPQQEDDEPVLSKSARKPRVKKAAAPAE